MRLDVYLTENGFADSRTEAKKLIQSGSVTLSGKEVTKPAYEVDGTEDIKVNKVPKKYASRGGFKLEGAIEAFDFRVEGALALDVGASSGGFTDCLLQNGAKHVISVDSGFGQMVEFLRRDDRVTVIEKFNARYMTAADLEYTPTLAVMDVSFISATYIIGAVYDVLADGGDFICLIKPQFELGRSALSKNGIVKDEKKRKMAVDKVTSYAESAGFLTLGIITSPIFGGDGNTEYIAHFRKRGQNETYCYNSESGEG